MFLSAHFLSERGPLEQEALQGHPETLGLGGIGARPCGLRCAQPFWPGFQAVAGLPWPLLISPHPPLLWADRGRGPCQPRCPLSLLPAVLGSCFCQYLWVFPCLSPDEVLENPPESAGVEAFCDGNRRGADQIPGSPTWRSIRP